MSSSVIHAHRYDPVRERLTITFQTGRRYAYLGVPPHIAAELEQDPSKGEYFNAMIRDVFPYERVRGAA
jgi:hypothetical protein